MRANKLETALSRDRLACLAPPDMFFSCRVDQETHYSDNFCHPKYHGYTVFNPRNQYYNLGDQEASLIKTLPSF